ncbi:hypothetical protein FCR2A7T_23120 [Flavobacterium cauense R2A-7]|uniref:Uncharacterized protein n=1 Tax=Flavobacterium cauense R2A-7 TaxID=1341154 RepID=V6RWP8_9FLAO|nr:hypothetical protein [Flavobacterium cauense]ESU18906.1 hypothetical protein FCR2A7T_23120 [Flavobacterium cauense R2A-7]KGO82455.1 hypothetical protein Q762_07245 [Flavobacterium cauense R2A-7]TWI15434.1 hypothetical protein IP98_00428 [Flavobacterium cauense R2A-7]
MILISACATYKGNYTTNTIILPVDINRLEGKWVIDEPILENIHASYNTKVIECYQNQLNNKFQTLVQIGDFNNTISLKKALETNIKTLDFYKEKTQFDYLISTKIKLNVDDNHLTKELYIKIITYNLNNKEKIYEKEYFFRDDFTGFNDSPLPSNLKRFLRISIEDCIKDFGKDKYWKYKSKT